MSEPLSTIVQRHWRGRVGLATTLLMTLIALRMLLSWATRLRPADWPMALFAVLTGLSALVLVWQVIGSWRASAREGSGAALAAGFSASIIAVALFATAELDSYAARSADRAAPPRNDTPARTLPVHGTALTLSGTLDWPLYRAFCQTLAANPQLELVALDSLGGLVPVARAMALRIDEMGLDTTATGLCASACTLAFMAGANRRLDPGGALGFHSYALLGYVPGSLPEQEARDRAWLEARGADPAFVSRVFATPHDKLWQPDRNRLRAAGVLRDGQDAPVPRQVNCGAGTP